MVKLLNSGGFRNMIIALTVLGCATGLAAFDKLGEQSVATLFGTILAIAAGGIKLANMNGKDTDA